jgi:hypothetical protein
METNGGDSGRRKTWHEREPLGAKRVNKATRLRGSLSRRFSLLVTD